MAAEGDIVCTAVRDGSGDLPNPLFTPPCQCPECAVDELETGQVAPDTIWLPVGGRPVRFDVDPVELGAQASAAL